MRAYFTPKDIAPAIAKIQRRGEKFEIGSFVRTMVSFKNTL
jgi:hypothetical protein